MAKKYFNRYIWLMQKHVHDAVIKVIISAIYFGLTRSFL